MLKLGCPHKMMEWHRVRAFWKDLSHYMKVLSFYKNSACLLRSIYDMKRQSITNGHQKQLGTLNSLNANIWALRLKLFFTTCIDFLPSLKWGDSYCGARWFVCSTSVGSCCWPHYCMVHFTRSTGMPYPDFTVYCAAKISWPRFNTLIAPTKSALFW